MIRPHRKINTKSRTSDLLPVAKNIPYTYKNILDKLEHKHASTWFRANVIATQAKNNYRNEYERLYSVLNSVVPALRPADMDRLKNRSATLEKLFEEATFTDYSINRNTNLSKRTMNI
jgi:uncharacterized protein YifN (PemK superfamily)